MGEHDDEPGENTKQKSSLKSSISLPIQLGNHTVAYFSSCKCEKGATGKCQVIAWVETMPKGRQCISQNSCIFFNTIINH